MDSIFGIGPLELALILIIAGIVMGPERMVRAARWLGQAVSQMQSMSQNLRAQLEKEVGTLDADGQLRETANELKSLQREVSALRQEVQNTAVSTVQETKQEFATLENSIQPPQINKAPDKPTPLPQPPQTPPPPVNHDIPRVLSIPDDPE